MDLGVHLPLLALDDEPLTYARLCRAVDTARRCEFAAVSANDHFVFRRPWLDGPTALASIAERAGGLTLATTAALPVVRGPVALAKTLAAIDVISRGRLVAALGPGSSPRDYDAVGIAFEERWARFDEALAVLRALLDGRPPPRDATHYALPADLVLAPRAGLPLWVASWGSRAGLRRVARAGDGWLASAYNTTPELFATGRERLAAALAAEGRHAEGFPNALATMWTWVSEDRAGADRMLREVLAPTLGRDPDELRERVCVGPAGRCAELLARYAEAGCERVYLWPLADEQRQLELVARDVATRLGP